jgi:hypothetical protein
MNILKMSKGSDEGVNIEIRNIIKDTIKEEMNGIKSTLALLVQEEIQNVLKTEHSVETDNFFRYLELVKKSKKSPSKRTHTRIINDSYLSKSI